MELRSFFKIYNKVALAFSGGTDSSYLLYAALKCGADVKAYFLKSPFQPLFELQDAIEFASQLTADLTIVEYDILSCREIAENGPERCYHCKKRMFQTILKHAHKDGYRNLIDGSNASDNPSERPGMKALSELLVLSPLKECGITKEGIRRLSKQAGLLNWDKPAYSCLATRIRQAETLSEEKLERIERAENCLRSLGFRDFRIRSCGNNAKIQVIPAQFPLLISFEETIYRQLGEYFDELTLDLEAMNE